MKTFKVGDKVKIPLTKSFGESFVDFKILLKDYKLDYLVISNLERKNFMLKRDDGIYLKYNTFTPEDLEHYEEYNKTFNPEAHSSLIIDFDKVETIEESAKTFEKVCFGDKSWEKVEEKSICYNSFIAGAKSEASKNHWFKIFQEEQKTIEQLFAELGVFEKVKVMRQLKKYV